jgi:hypothetical protein
MASVTNRRKEIILGLTHIARSRWSHSREYQQNVDKGYPCNSNCTDRDKPASQTKGSGNQFIATRCDAEEDGRSIGCVKPNNGRTRMVCIRWGYQRQLNNGVSPSQGNQGGRTETKKAANSRAEHDEPDGIYRSLSVRVDLFPPSRARERVITGECKDNTRGIYALGCTCSELADLSFPD